MLGVWNEIHHFFLILVKGSIVVSMKNKQIRMTQEIYQLEHSRTNKNVETKLVVFLFPFGQLTLHNSVIQVHKENSGL